MKPLTACPDCGANVGKGASKCRCGWQAVGQAAAARPVTMCACGERATIRIGDKDSCAKCYERTPIERTKIFSPLVEEVLTAFKSSRYAKRVREVGVDVAKAEAMREPGSDDEERRAA